MRNLCLSDLPVHGRAFQAGLVLENLIGCIEARKMRHAVTRICPLCDIIEVRGDSLAREHTGKLVVVPPLITP